MLGDLWKRLGPRQPLVPKGFSISKPRAPVDLDAIVPPLVLPLSRPVFSTDGSRLAVAGGGSVVGRADIHVYHLGRSEHEAVCSFHGAGVHALAFSPSGELYSASHDYSVVAWRVDQGDATFLMGGANANVSRERLAYRAGTLFVGDGMTWCGQTASLHALRPERGEARVLMRFPRPEGVTGLFLVGSDELIATTADVRSYADGTRVYWMNQRGSVRKRLHLDYNPLSIEALPDGSLLTIGQLDTGSDAYSLVHVSRHGETREVRTLGSHIGGDLSLSPDHTKLAMVHDSQLALLDAATMRELWKGDLSADPALSVAWSPDGTRLAVSTKSRSVRVIDLPSVGPR